MGKIEISEETIKKVNAFKKLINYILGDELPNESAYIEMILFIGLDRMLQDLLPEEEMLLKTMVQMFKECPEFVCDFILRRLKEGESILAEKEEQTKKNWMFYVA
ncbi:MAG: hypothetical protein NWE89_12975 [Candidatus Bathyarchaeota archaeon]|nr:hypothetical protein [Candidatus Bathyarchaeota archaeon]